MTAQVNRVVLMDIWTKNARDWPIPDWDIAYQQMPQMYVQVKDGRTRIPNMFTLVQVEVAREENIMFLMPFPKRKEVIHKRILVPTDFLRMITIPYAIKIVKSSSIFAWSDINVSPRINWLK